MDAEPPLTDAEIEAILEQEANALPAESHLEPPPVPLAQREPGKGRYGRVVAWLLIAFSVWTVWQSMR